MFISSVKVLVMITILFIRGTFFIRVNFIHIQLTFTSLKFSPFFSVLCFILLLVSCSSCVIYMKYTAGVAKLKKKKTKCISLYSHLFMCTVTQLLFINISCAHGLHVCIYISVLLPAIHIVGLIGYHIL